MKKLILILTILFVGTFSFADEPAKKFVLDNGQTVVIKSVRSNPIVTIDTWIKTGSINETDSNNGVSHFLEHLFFKGSKNHAPGEFDSILENKGAITNAATSKDFTHYYITLPSKFFNEAMELHADMLLNPLVPRKELEKERKVVLEEISKDENTPQHVVYDNLVSLIYSTHPYKRKVIGKRNIIETIHRNSIMEYYKKWYVPSNMITVIVGDVDSETALEKVKANFSGNTQRSEKQIYPKEQLLTSQKRKLEYLDTQVAYMLIGFRSVDINNTDMYALDVLATILGDGRSSVFYRNIKDKLQLAHSIDASNSSFRDDGIFYVSSSFSPEKLDKLEQEIFENISNIQKNGVTEEQLNLAKNIIERTTYYQRESVSNIAQEIGYIAVTSGDTKIYDSYLTNIKKVSAQDVKRVALKYLGKDKSAVSIVMPLAAKDVKISNITKSPTHQATLQEESNGTQKYLLENDATLLLTPNTTNEIVAISILVKGGGFTEPKYGIAKLTAATMMKGTEKYSPQELVEILEDNGIKIAPSTRSDAFLINVLTTTPQYEKTLELLSEIVNNAKFSSYEIEKVKKDTLNAIKRSRDIPLNLALENYKDRVYADTPYVNSTILLEKNIPEITDQDLISYYNSVFNPKNIVISINGNVPKDTTINSFSTMFKSNKEDTFDYAKYSNKIKPITEPRTVIQKIPTTNTDWIILAWQTAGLDDKKDYATLQVIDSLLGTGMSSRLFKNLREQEGLAYQLGSGYSANALRGVFVLYIGTNPDTCDKALEGLRNEIKTLKTEFVGTKDLQEAKEKLLGRFILSLETNMDKAATQGWHETAEHNYKFIQEYESLINSVTENDIIRVANKYFKDNNYVLSMVKK